MYVVGILTDGQRQVEISTVPSRQEAEELQKNLGESCCRISPSVVPFGAIFRGWEILYSPHARKILERELAAMRATREARLRLIDFFSLHEYEKILV